MRKHGYASSTRIRHPEYGCRAIAWTLFDIFNFRHEPATHFKLIGQRVTLVVLLAVLIVIIFMMRP
jgi:hypothetical protein